MIFSEIDSCILYLFQQTRNLVIALNLNDENFMLNTIRIMLADDTKKVCQRQKIWMKENLLSPLFSLYHN